MRIKIELYQYLGKYCFVSLFYNVKYSMKQLSHDAKVDIIPNSKWPVNW